MIHAHPVDTQLTDVVALFVDPLGPYPLLVDDWYDELRDARTYRGPHPVVAHPPCQLWVNFACVNFKRYGRAHNRPGNDGGCFKAALDAVRAYGGVLEHPAGSRAWAEYDLERPNTPRMWNMVGRRNEWVCEVWQSAYGHKARKKDLATVRRSASPAEGRLAPQAGHAPMWMVRPNQADTRKTRGIADAQTIRALSCGPCASEWELTG